MRRWLPLPLVMSIAMLAACGGRGFADPSREFGPPVAADAPLQQVSVHRPAALGALDTHRVDHREGPVGISCETCHGPAEGGPLAEQADVEPLHQDIEVEHGDLSCAACHDASDRTRLHLADGTPVAFADTLQLCAQCHGVQTRDYRRGSHGGMAGYWDLRRGPRTRNHCVDCHAPHAPAYGAVLPVLPPRDRYFRTRSDGEEH